MQEQERGRPLAYNPLVIKQIFVHKKHSVNGTVRCNALLYREMPYRGYPATESNPEKSVLVLQPVKNEMALNRQWQVIQRA